MNLKEATQILNHPSIELFRNPIKILSTFLISLAILWELGNVYAKLNNWEISSNLNWVFVLDRIMLISHAIEGMIAAYYVRLQNKNPLQYGIYIFFTGTPGLLELKIGQQGSD